MTMSITMTSAPEEVAEHLRGIADPLERVTAAAAVVHRRQALVANTRQQRDKSVISAHLDHNVPPVTLYRDVLQCSRTLFVRMIARAGANHERFDDALEQARIFAERAREHQAVIDVATEIRDQTALLLMNGGVDPISNRQVTAMANADIARATGLTTARIAQVRTGA